MTGPPSPALNLLPDTYHMLGMEGDRPRVVRAVFREARGVSEPGGVPDPACCLGKRAEKGEEV